MIKSLTTENFKKLGTTNLVFAPTSTIITGDNGAGKTTIFEAIKFALFGSAAITGDKKVLPTFGCKDCRVTLELTHFTISRTLGNCQVHDPNGNLLAAGHSACTAYVEQELGMDYKAFSIFIMSNQGDTSALLTLGATELNRRVESYAGVTVIDAIIKDVAADTRALKQQLDEMTLHDLEAEAIEISQVQEQLTVATKKKEVFSRNCKEIKAESERISADLLKRSSENSKIENAQAQLPLLDESISKARAELATQQAELVRVDELLAEAADADPDHIKALSVELDGKLRLQTLTQDATKRLQELITESDALDAKVKASQDATIRVKTLDNEIPKVRNTLQDKRLRLSHVEEGMKQAKQALDEGVCPTCQRPHENFDEAAIKAQLDELKCSQIELFDGIKSYEIIVDAAEERRTEQYALIGDYTDDLIRVQKQIEECAPHAGRNLAALEEEIEDLKTRYRQATHNLSIREHLGRERLSIRKRIEQIECDIEVYMDKKMNLAHVAKRPVMDTAAMVKTQEEITAKLEKFYIKAQEVVMQETELTAEVRRLDEIYTRHQAENFDYEVCADKHTKAEMLLGMLRSRRLEFMTSVWSRILAAATAFVTEATGGWITQVHRDESGNFLYSENGGILVPVIGGASGAQRGFLGVAMRIGMTQALLGNHSMLFLDEPTEAMNEARASNLASGLIGIGGQTVLITHRHTDSVAASSIIEV